MNSARAFTLIELLVVISIVLVLTGLLIPAVAAVRNSAKRTTADMRVKEIETAMGVYRLEDPQKRFPPAETDFTLRLATTTTAAAPRALDRLSVVGLTWRGEDLAPDAATGRPLLDPWKQPYRYRLDDNMDAVINRPIDVTDWNPRGEEPWAYVWSAGKPIDGNTENDATNAKAWIYSKAMP